MPVYIDEVDSQVSVQGGSGNAKPVQSWQQTEAWRREAECAAEDAARTAAWGSDD
ncbi:hypothetical protein [Chitinolyticbacter albus]|uniref:hypothetical protein n=1 Tax=Chitinolyticbacter albus TaxID=2961951 RepID=UPI00210901DF|nr:hypothetical protein [Chitinolyticbacter albus]